MAAAHKRVQPHRSRTLREPTTVFTGACRRVVAVRPSWAWLREPAGRTGVAALASGDTLVRTPYPVGLYESVLKLIMWAMGQGASNGIVPR